MGDGGNGAGERKRLACWWVEFSEGWRPRVVARPCALLRVKDLLRVDSARAAAGDTRPLLARAPPFYRQKARRIRGRVTTSPSL